MKKTVRSIVVPLLAAASLSVLLGAAAGTQTDPVVTLSYLTDVNTPAVLAQVDAKLSLREQALVDKLNAAVSQFEQDLAGQTDSGGNASAPSAVFSVVTVKSGQKLLGGVGCEFLLRSGNATCVSSSAPGLIDSTGGTTLPGGGTVQLNHLYLSTAESRGFQASSDLIVLVRGSYTVT